MIKNISLPELHNSNPFVDKDDDDDHSITNKKEPWSIKKAMNRGEMFNMVGFS
jgi:hypothetical protein